MLEETLQFARKGPIVQAIGFWIQGVLVFDNMLTASREGKRGHEVAVAKVSNFRLRRLSSSSKPAARTRRRGSWIECLLK